MSGRGPSIFLFLLGSWLVALGAHRWYEQRSVSQIALKFMTAVVEGDPETALSLLAADAPQHALAADAWPVIEDVELQIEGRTFRGDTAEIVIRAEKQQFLLHPHVHLTRNDEGEWKITKLTNLEIDPRWEKFRNWEAKQNAEQLAEQLHLELQDAAP